MNGHAIIYGMRRWGHPTWMPEDRQAMEPLFEKHVQELAERYGGRVQRWDVVNESIDQANRGLMPDDYTFKTFAWANSISLPSCNSTATTTTSTPGSKCTAATWRSYAT